MPLIPLSWIREFVEGPASPKEAAHLLTMSGTIVESVEGEILELEITPNRGDCLSVIGVARELAAVTGRSLRVPEPVVREWGDPNLVPVTIEAPDLCPRYSARLLRNIEPRPSPAWMQERLIVAGLRPVNAVVDVTNYVMIERGQPLHAFDYDRLRGGRIVVRRAEAGEQFTTLDGQEHALDPSILTIRDAEGPVALAGVRGGLNSEVTGATRTVLLESAHFEAGAIRAAVRRLNAGTDSSYRFERIVDPSGTVAALDRAAQLLQEIAGAEVAPGVVDVYPRPIVPRTISFRPARADRLVGHAIAPGAQRDSLERLGLEVVEESPDRFTVRVPTFRPDLVQEDDLVEEVARMYGYANVPYRLPAGSFAGRMSDAQISRRRARRALVECGFQELLTHTLVDPARLARFSDLPARRVRNPLSEEFAALRTTLLSTLVDAAQRNARHGRRDIHLFEVAQVFIPSPRTAAVEEPIRVGGLLCGTRMAGRWNLKPVPLEADFFAAKGVVESLIGEFHVRDVRFEAATATGLHPGRTARVSIGGEPAGIVGQIHPAIEAEFELPGPTYAFEIDLGALVRASEPPRARPLARFPGISRDLAMLVSRETPAERVRQAIVRAGGGLLEDASLFDVYSGAGVPEGSTSLAFSVRFRAPDRTLTDAEVDAAVAAIRNALAEEAGATAR